MYLNDNIWFKLLCPTTAILRSRYRLSGLAFHVYSPTDSPEHAVQIPTAVGVLPYDNLGFGICAPKQ